MDYQGWRVSKPDKLLIHKIEIVYNRSIKISKPFSMTCLNCGEVISHRACVRRSRECAMIHSKDGVVKTMLTMTTHATIEKIKLDKCIKSSVDEHNKHRASIQYKIMDILISLIESLLLEKKSVYHPTKSKYQEALCEYIDSAKTSGDRIEFADTSMLMLKQLNTLEPYFI